MPRRRTHDAVSIDIAQTPERIYDLVADITRMGEWSPECYRCSWTGGAHEPAVVRHWRRAADQGIPSRQWSSESASSPSA